MKIISWNVNGLRAVLNKGFLDFFNEKSADIFCIQETKMQKEQAKFDFPGYYEYWNCAEKKGYSGTLILTKSKPLSVSYGIGIEEHDKEGRVITLEFKDFYMVNCYTPNSKRELERLDYRQVWEDDFRRYLNKLNERKPVILCGDLNVAHKEIDLKNPKTNRHNAGFEVWQGNAQKTKFALTPTEMKYHDYTQPSNPIMEIDKEGNFTTRKGTLGMFMNMTKNVDNLDTINESGLYWCLETAKGVPTKGTSWGIIHFQPGSKSQMQIAFPYHTDMKTYKLKMRRTGVEGNQQYTEWMDL